MNRASVQCRRAQLLILACLAIAGPAVAQFEANRRPPRPQVTLPDGPVRQVILRRCTQCHGIDEYGYYAMERERWAAVIERMKTATSGVVTGTAITENESQLLLDWLVTEYGPDSTPMAREYVIAELAPDERLSNAQGQGTLESACQDCHGLARIQSAALTTEQWRERVTREIGRGAAMLIQDAEPFVQWLAERTN